MDRPTRLQAATAKVIRTLRGAREDFPSFVESVWANHPDFRLADFHLQWCDALAKGGHVYIEGPRGHAKTLISMAFVLWSLGRDPNERIKLVAANDKEARKRLFEIKQHVLENESLHLVFPDLRPMKHADWSKSRIVVERSGVFKDPSIEATGVLSGSLGSRATMIVLDDVVDSRNALLQPQLRNHIKHKVLGELFPTLEPGGRVVAIGTPWTTLDLNAILRASPGFTLVSTPVGTPTDPFAPIWPEVFGRDELLKIFSTVGQVEYDRAYRCVALASDVAPMNPEWIRYYDAETLGDPNVHLGVQSYDPAIAQTADADYTAGVTLLWDEERGLIFVADAWRSKLSVNEQVTAITDSALTWRPQRIVIEVGNYQGALAEFLSEQKVFLPIWPYRPRGSKARRLMAVSPLIEQGKVLFHPSLDPRKNPQVGIRGDIISELLTFPNGAHDDMVDALVNGIASIREEMPSGESLDILSDRRDTEVRLSLV